MQLNVYAGNQYSLQFPVMSDAYLRIDYSDNIASEPTGLWAHKGSFSMEMIFTPYDINGFGSDEGFIWNVPNLTGNQNSRKTMPSTYKYYAASAPTGDPTKTPASHQDLAWLDIEHRFKHKPILFYNTNCTVNLYNNTTQNHNQPAEYGLEFTLLIGGITETIKTEPFIKARHGHYNDFADPLIYAYKGNKAIAHGHFAMRSRGTPTINNPSNATFRIYNYYTVPTSTTLVDKMRQWLNVGDTLYLGTGVELGTIVSYTEVNDTGTGYEDVVVKMDTSRISGSIIDGTFDSNYGAIYLSTAKEALYLLSSYHIGVGYDNSTRKMTIHVNGQEAISKVHGSKITTANFEFAPEDCFIGQNPNDSNILTKRQGQFIGEIHEMSIENRYKNDFSSFYTLLPSNRNLLLYLDFEEVDE